MFVRILIVFDLITFFLLVFYENFKGSDPHKFSCRRGLKFEIRMKTFYS